MNLSILISEKQQNLILTESIGENFGYILKRNYDLVKKVLKETSGIIGSNLEFLITWGASIGGMIGPLDDFIRGKEVGISDVQISLLLTGIISLYYVDNKELSNKIINKIKDEGLFNIFKKLQRKSEVLKNVFFDFISSLGLTISKVTNIMGYTFVIPLIPMIYEMAIGANPDKITIAQLVKRIIAFGLLTLTGVAIKELISKMVKRFKNKK